jgi:D-beta-D-heptose 7-phosphate kinase/D-beta-D-heptose 1-phosphate adenosyltransferase
VVGKRGTAVVEPAELRRAIAAAPHDVYSARDKILAANAAVDQVAAWKQQGHKVGFTNGCFDILHAGHIRLIDFSRAHCGRLIVGLNTDASVRRLKGPSRPINVEDERALLLASLANVDAVVLFGEETPRDLIAALLPDVLIKGADYTVDQIAGAEEVIASGGEVLLCELMPGRSTTRILAQRLEV